MNTRPASSPAEHNSLVVNGAAVEAQLRELLQKRILILDGATGTMIQQYKLTEAQYRGERFADFHRDIKGNNELLVLTQPAIMTEIHEQYLAAGADSKQRCYAVYVANSNQLISDKVTQACRVSVSNSCIFPRYSRI